MLACWAPPHHSEADGPHVPTHLEELAKYTSSMYKSLPEEQKKAWEAYAAHDKMRYETELASYAPPEGYSKTGLLILDQSEEGEEKQRDTDLAPVARADQDAQEETADVRGEPAMRMSDGAKDQYEHPPPVDDLPDAIVPIAHVYV